VLMAGKGLQGAPAAAPGRTVLDATVSRNVDFRSSGKGESDQEQAGEN